MSRIRSKVIDLDRGDLNPESALEVVKSNIDLLTFLMYSFQAQADRFNKGCTIELNYTYLEDLKVAKLVSVVAKGQIQDIPVNEFLASLDEEGESDEIHNTKRFT